MSTVPPKTKKNVVPFDETPPPLSLYPEVSEPRALKVILDAKEREALTQELARSIGEIAQLEDEKKSSASNFKYKIEEKQSRQGRLSLLITDGYEQRSVESKWEFETSGVDESGKPIHHPEFKTLFRSDTGEVVEVMAMTDYDFERRELALGNTKAEPEPVIDDGDEPL